MSLHIDERDNGQFALYIDGDLQFDTEDEAIYHESLALPALCLARPADGKTLRVLICGGGDGMALRECLRFPGVTHVDLVDYSPEVVELGQTRFAEINAHAFADPRAHIHIADAWEFLTDTAPYDVILCDFTVPRRPDDMKIFTVEWYERVKSALAPGGIAALNAVSPQFTPEAFWSLHKTVRTAGLKPFPYHVCIPSFRDAGYGAWGFLLAAHHPITAAAIRSLACPVPTRQIDLTKLWRGVRFHREDRLLEQHVPINTLADAPLLRLMLNPGTTGKDLAVPDPLTGPYDLNPLLRSIPIAHPYHTRMMVETLAEQVMGSIGSLDIRRLVDSLLRRAAQLPDGLRSELRRLKEFLLQKVPSFQIYSRWMCRLFATLVILMTLANAIAPDNAFAKGSFGIGRASMSRGYSASSRSTGGSFGGATRSTGSSFGTAGRARSVGPFGHGSQITSTGFRGRYAANSVGYGRGRPTDIYGNVYSERVFVYGGYHPGYYHGYYYGHNGTSARPANAPPPQTQKALFVADDDMMVLENGDVVVTLSDDAYLLLNDGNVALFHKNQPDPLLPVYPDPNLFKNVLEQLQEQKQMAEDEIGTRKDWLAWVGWTSAFAPSVQGDKIEVQNLQDLLTRLDKAIQQLGKPPANATPVPAPTGAVELFAGGYLMPDGRTAIRRPDGLWTYTDGKQVWSDKPGEKAQPAAPELNLALKSILTKLDKELEADLTADDKYITDLSNDRESLLKDRNEYQSLANQYGQSYEVDYGTDEVSCSTALANTDRDLDANKAEVVKTFEERKKDATDLETLRRVTGSNRSYTAPPAPRDPLQFPGTSGTSMPLLQSSPAYTP